MRRSSPFAVLLVVATACGGDGVDGRSVDAGATDAARDGGDTMDGAATDAQPSSDATAPSDATAGRDAMTLQDAGDAGHDAGDAGDAGHVVDGGERFAAIYLDVVATTCSSSTCHQAGGESGLDMSSQAAAWHQLVELNVGANQQPSGSPCAVEYTGQRRVIAGDADASLLYHKLTRTDDAVCGDRMPRNESALSGAELERIRRWIDQGALYD